jgi:decaprenylphospho-beta-D-erythro-pentofuranosid-2-ulose 2-reductase
MPTVLILGAGSDIGMEIARKFASEKFDLQLAARRPQLLGPACSDLTIRYGIKVNTYAFDALKYGGHVEFFNSLSPVPDITVCVFGILDQESRAFNDWSVAERMINTNYTGAVSILNAAAKKYISRRNGTIIGISSVAGDRGRASKLIYASAKAAFTTYLSGLRNLCYREGVQVLTILPGFVNTKMTAQQSLPQLITAQPSEVAEIIYSAYLKKRNVVYIKWYWKYIMFIIKIIPEFQFKKMNL